MKYYDKRCIYNSYKDQTVLLCIDIKKRSSKSWKSCKAGLYPFFNVVYSLYGESNGKIKNKN